jgi:hypothetical protein
LRADPRTTFSPFSTGSITAIMGGSIKVVIDSECQVLYDERKSQKDAVRRQFGVGFESGNVDLVD